MALTFWQMMRLVIMPQALKLVIPGIVNTFIGLFKDTSLVLIIGLFDLLGIVQQNMNDQNWISPATPATGFVFAAFVFFIFCFGMSRYSVIWSASRHRPQTIKGNSTMADSNAAATEGADRSKMRCRKPMSPSSSSDMNKWYGDFHVLRDINLKVMRGERSSLPGRPVPASRP
jgi:hypothetical protein